MPSLNELFQTQSSLTIRVGILVTVTVTLIQTVFSCCFVVGGGGGGGGSSSVCVFGGGAVLVRMLATLSGWDLLSCLFVFAVFLLCP